ncbi:Transcription factor iws1 [Agyrium rufum]|nr:Transcription factor iws1 [Agyrium rufum]
MSSASGSLPGSPLPEAGNDPSDPNQPQYDFKDPPTPPVADPTMDMDDVSDNESVLSDIDEAQFEDFRPDLIEIDERPEIAVDEDNVKLLGRHKRKRTDAEDGDFDIDAGKKKKKEGKREKPKKNRKKADDSDEGFSGGEEMQGKRVRKRKEAGEGGTGEKKERARTVRKATPEDEDMLSPEERRKRALDRAMDAALKNPNRRRRKIDGIDLNSQLDEEIASLRTRMAEAAEADVKAREADPPRPAMHKLKLLPEVSSLLNRNGREIENAIVDPENNLLESVRFFLEPLNDGSLPAYNIQRELFSALAKLPVGKESLISSGIGKVVLFYTKSKKPELGIKRQAERLLGEWTLPILKRSDDYRKRVLQTAEYDPSRAPMRKGQGGTQQMSQAEIAAKEREKALAPPVKNPNRARMETNYTSYSIVPRSSQAVGGGQFSRPMGASGEDAFRRMKARQLQAQGKGPRR